MKKETKMILCPIVQRKVLKVLVVIMVMKMNTIILFVIVGTKPCVVVDDLPEGASPLLGVFPEFSPAGDGVGKAHDLENVQEDSTLEYFRMFYPDIIFDKLLTATNS